MKMNYSEYEQECLCSSLLDIQSSGCHSTSNRKTRIFSTQRTNSCYTWTTGLNYIPNRLTKTFLLILMVLGRVFYIFDRLCSARTFLITFWLLLGVTQLANTAKSQEIFQQNSKLIDADAFVGKHFVYKLPASQFGCNVDRLEVSEGSTRTLPGWLAYNEDKQELYGVATFKDTGTYEILAVALTNSSTGTGRICGIRAFNIKVLASSNFPERKTALSSITIENSLQNPSQCPPGSQTIIATILFSGDIHEMSGHQRTSVLTSMANHLSIPSDSLAVFTADNGHPVLSQFDQLSVLNSGSGEARFQAGQKSLLTWILSCGTVRLTDSKISKIESTSQDGTLSKILGFPIVGWHITTGVQKSKHRGRRAIGNTPTPVATSALPTRVTSSSIISISESSSFILNSTIEPQTTIYSFASSTVSASLESETLVNLSSPVFFPDSSTSFEVPSVVSTVAPSSGTVYSTVSMETIPTPSLSTAPLFSVASSSSVVLNETSFVPMPSTTQYINATISILSSSIIFPTNSSMASSIYQVDSTFSVEPSSSLSSKENFTISPSATELQSTSDISPNQTLYLTSSLVNLSLDVSSVFSSKTASVALSSTLTVIETDRMNMTSTIQPSFSTSSSIYFTLSPSLTQNMTSETLTIVMSSSPLLPSLTQNMTSETLTDVMSSSPLLPFSSSFISKSLVNMTSTEISTTKMSTFTSSVSLLPSISTVAVVTTVNISSMISPTIMNTSLIDATSSVFPKPSLSIGPEMSSLKTSTRLMSPSTQTRIVETLNITMTTRLQASSYTTIPGIESSSHKEASIFNTASLQDSITIISDTERFTTIYSTPSTGISVLESTAGSLSTITMTTPLMKSSTLSANISIDASESKITGLSSSITMTTPIMMSSQMTSLNNLTLSTVKAKSTTQPDIASTISMTDKPSTLVKPSLSIKDSSSIIVTPSEGVASSVFSITTGSLSLSTLKLIPTAIIPSSTTSSDVITQSLDSSSKVIDSSTLSISTESSSVEGTLPISPTPTPLMSQSSILPSLSASSFSQSIIPTTGFSLSPEISSSVIGSSNLSLANSTKGISPVQTDFVSSVLQSSSVFYPSTVKPSLTSFVDVTSSLQSSLATASMTESSATSNFTVVSSAIETVSLTTSTEEKTSSVFVDITSSPGLSTIVLSSFLSTTIPPTVSTSALLNISSIVLPSSVVTSVSTSMFETPSLSISVPITTALNSSIVDATSTEVGLVSSIFSTSLLEMSSAGSFSSMVHESSLALSTSVVSSVVLSSLQTTLQATSSSLFSSSAQYSSISASSEISILPSGSTHVVSSDVQTPSLNFSSLAVPSTSVKKTSLVSSSIVLPTSSSGVGVSSESLPVSTLDISTSSMLIESSVALLPSSRLVQSQSVVSFGSSTINLVPTTMATSVFQTRLSSSSSPAITVIQTSSTLGFSSTSSPSLSSNISVLTSMPTIITGGASHSTVSPLHPQTRSMVSSSTISTRFIVSSISILTRSSVPSSFIESRPVGPSPSSIVSLSSIPLSSIVSRSSVPSSPIVTQSIVSSSSISTRLIVPSISIVTRSSIPSSSLVTRSSVPLTSSIVSNVPSVSIIDHQTSHYSPSPSPVSQSLTVMYSSRKTGASLDKTVSLATSAVLPSSIVASSSVAITTPRPNSKPVLKNDIGRIQTTAGIMFSYTVPQDTFHDEDGGNTRQLNLTMQRVVEATAQDIPANFWLKFDSSKQVITGLPMEKDIPDLSDPEIGVKFLLTAKDSHGAVAYDVFEILIGSSANTPYTQSLTVTLSNDFEVFNNDLNQRLNLLEKISGYYKDPDTSLIKVLSYQKGSVILSWTNVSLPSDECDKEKLNSVAEKVVDGENSVQTEFKDFLSPQFEVTSANRTFSGVCVGITASPPLITPRNEARESTELWEKHVIPGIIIAIILIILAILLICFIRRRRRAKPADHERLTYTKRKPIILDPEMEMKPIPGKPLILDGESPLSHPPSYLSEPSDYQSPYGYYDNGIGDYDEEDSTPTKGSPVYETPPPSYMQPEEPEEPPPPPYMLPPTMMMPPSKSYPIYELPMWEESSDV